MKECGVWWCAGRGFCIDDLISSWFILRDGYSHSVDKQTESRERHRQAGSSAGRIPPSSMWLQSLPFLYYPQQQTGAGLHPARRGSLPVGACELPFGESQLLSVCLCTGSPCTTSRPEESCSGGEQPQKAGEEVVLPPSAGQTTRTSAAHRICTGVSGGLGSLRMALSL